MGITKQRNAVGMFVLTLIAALAVIATTGASTLDVWNTKRFPGMETRPPAEGAYDAFFDYGVGAFYWLPEEGPGGQDFHLLVPWPEGARGYELIGIDCAMHKCSGTRDKITLQGSIGQHLVHDEGWHGWLKAGTLTTIP